MTARVLDIGSQNPRIQCGECGQWKRLHGVVNGKAIDRFYGSCEVTMGDHPCGGDVCTNCCPDKCRQRLSDTSQLHNTQGE
jgi:hypothetical protein